MIQPHQHFELQRTMPAERVGLSLLAAGRFR
jgi:hypothetical protein